MTEYEILDLLFQRYDSFQTIWGIFTTVTIGLLAGVISFPTQLASITGRLIMIFGFVAFSLVNLDALLKLVEERNSLKNEAICIIHKLPDCDKSKIDAAQLEIKKPLHELLDNMDLVTKGELRFFHHFQSVLMVLLIWFVPKVLIRLKPKTDFENQKVRIRKSKLPSPILSYSQSEKMWKLENDIVVSVQNVGNDEIKKIFVPKGFEFDLASIPRVFWSLMAPFELSIIGPLIHDFLYVNEGELYLNDEGVISDKETPNMIKIDRYQTDNLFLAQMRQENVGKLKSWLAFYGVRLFGWVFWKEN